MQAAKLLGLTLSTSAMLTGAYYALTPITQALHNHTITGHQAGNYYATVACIIAFSCAVIGTLASSKAQ